MNKKKIVIASTNEGKIREFREMLETEYEVFTLKDFKDHSDVVENGKTFAENAVIKAAALTNQYGIMAIADDSGLMIDAFHGGPGVHSARYLGHDTSYDYKNKIILERMEGVQERGCRYVCAIAITRPNEEPVTFVDTCECVIAQSPRGQNGFGYDPIVFYEPFQKTMADMTNEEKNSISHRGKAIQKLRKWLDENR